MIYYTITATATSGKEEQATKWLLRYAEFFNTKYAKYGHIEIARSMDGAGKMHWVAKCPSMAAFEEVGAVLRTDSANAKLGKEGEGLVGPGESHFYEIVEG